MRKKFVLTVVALSLFVGCASKKADTIDLSKSPKSSSVGSSRGSIGSSSTRASTRVNSYENVDPYGTRSIRSSSSSSSNSRYSRDHNRNGSSSGSGINDGTYGSLPYTQNSDYGNLNKGLKNVYFGVDKYAITPDKLPIIIKNAKLIKKATRTGARVQIEGHCDATGTDEYNYALGLRRAKSAKEAIILQGVKPSAISIVSLGESSPLCTSSYSAQCLAKNRRVEFKIVE